MPRGPEYQKDRSERQHRRILEAITKEPMSSQDLADALFLTRDMINRHLNDLQAEPRQIHVARYRYNPKGGQPCKLYAPGDKPDAQFVRQRAGTRHLIAKNRMKEIAATLKAQPMTVRQLAESLELSDSWTRVYINRMRTGKRRKLHISGWKNMPCSYAPIYAYGDLPDAEYVKWRPAVRKPRVAAPWFAPLSYAMPTQHQGSCT